MYRCNSLYILTKFKHMNNLNNAVAVLLITAMLFMTIGTSLVLAASDKYMTNFGTLSLIIASLLTITAMFITPKK